MPALDFRKLLDRNMRPLGIGKRHRDGEIGDRQNVAKQIGAAAQMLVQDMAVLQDLPVASFVAASSGGPSAKIGLMMCSK